MMSYVPMLVGLIIGVVLCTMSACLVHYHEEKSQEQYKDFLHNWVSEQLTWATEEKESQIDFDMKFMFHGAMRAYESVIRMLYHEGNKAKDKKD